VAGAGGKEQEKYGIRSGSRFWQYLEKAGLPVNPSKSSSEVRMHDKISGREHFTWPQTQQRERGWCVFFIVFMNDLPQYHHPWFLSNSGFCFTFSISPDVLCSCVSKENRCIIIISSHPQYLLRGEASCRCTDRHIDVCKTMMTKCCRLRNGHLQWNHFHRYNLLAYTSSGTCLTLHRQNTSLFAIRNRGFSTQV